MKRILTFFALAILAAGTLQAKVYVVSSPDRKTQVEVTVEDGITWTVTHAGQEVLAPSAISLTLNGREIGPGARVKSIKTEKVKNTVTAPFWRQASIAEYYNQLTLNLEDGWSVIFRAYDGEGVAYRFCSTSLKKGDRVDAERAEFNFSHDYTAYVTSWC